jgi:phosphoenolpyruvate carboxykinase (GTP)
VNENISKIDRIINIYKDLKEGAPEEIFEVLKDQKKRLEKIKSSGGDYISPKSF